MRLGNQDDEGCIKVIGHELSLICGHDEPNAVLHGGRAGYPKLKWEIGANVGNW